MPPLLLGKPRSGEGAADLQDTSDSVPGFCLSRDPRYQKHSPTSPTKNTPCKVSLSSRGARENWAVRNETDVLFRWPRYLENRTRRFLTVRLS